MVQEAPTCTAGTSRSVNDLADTTLSAPLLQEAHAVLARGGLSEETAAETLAACGDNSIHVHVPGKAVVQVGWQDVMKATLFLEAS